MPNQTATLQLDRTLADYWTLTKPEVNFLILIATSAGFYMGLPEQSQAFPFMRLLHTLIGTLLVASGTGTLNQYIEREFDALMRRTRSRPLPAGRMEPSAALWFGTLISIAGAVYLAALVNPLASLLAVFTLASYLFVYTPLKRRTPLCTFVGAFPGAMPVLIGWAGASGSAGPEALGLYALLFLWQFPHFMAIAWIYRHDYAGAGYFVLPKGEQGAYFMASTTVVTSAALIPLTIGLARATHAGLALTLGSVMLSFGYFFFSLRLALEPSTMRARRLLAASIFYLPIALLLVVLGK
jgi:protoheme IX farnesyltransferase